MRSGDRAKHKVCGSTVPQLFEFDYREKTFHAHHFVDDKGRVRMATWQFSYEGIPITYIREGNLVDAVTAFHEMAHEMGDRFDEKLTEVVAENTRRVDAAQS